MSKTLTIRPAVYTDLPKLVSIYNHYVLQTPITFDVETHSVEQRQDWFDSFDGSGRHRLLVAEQEGEVIGYASSSRFNPRRAYDTSVETTIYIDPASTQSGVGTRLYSELLRQLITETALHRAYGGITLPNDASVALHEKLGFERVGLYREVGYKFDRYWDVARYEKNLSSR